VVSARAVRFSAVGACIVGIAGMIVTSALNHNGAAITFGIITTVAVLCSMVATAVAADTLGQAPTALVAGVPARSEALAGVVEEQVQALVEAGTDERALRQLVGEAVRLGRTLGPTFS
jgi:hypothetical protein